MIVLNVTYKCKPDIKVEFYEQMGYEICGEAADCGTFRCVRMEKDYMT